VPALCLTLKASRSIADIDRGEPDRKRPQRFGTVSPMSPEEVSVLAIELLDGAVAAVTTKGRRQVQNASDALALVVLAMSAGEFVTTSNLCSLLHCDRDALQKRLSRARQDTGVTIANDRSADGYRLKLDPEQVDALRLLRTARLPASQCVPATAKAVLGLWRSGPPDYVRTNLPSLIEPLEKARSELRRRLPKQVLIIDDKVGDHLAELLSDLACTVAHDLKEFRKYELRLSEFDLALVDINLTASYEDHHGLVIVNRIVSADTDVLVLAMTLKPAKGALTEWTRNHDLVELMHKTGDDETADFTEVVDQVRKTLAAGPQEQITKLLAGFPKIIEEAKTKLLAAGMSAESRVMRVEAGRVLDLQFEGTLSQVRTAIRDFRSRWNVEFPLT
jgi:hypothetical protein